MQVDGHCHCGAIAYSAEANPEHVSICYCTDCQRLTGSAFRVSLAVRAENFVLKAGQPKTYVKTAESGARRVQAFCGDCGAPIYSTAEKDPTHYMLRVGTINQRSELPPRMQLWTRSKPAWVEPMAGIQSYEKDGPKSG